VAQSDRQSHVTNAKETPDERYFASFITTRDDDEAARSLRTLVDLPASAEEIAGICRAEKVGATLRDLDGRTVGHIDAEGHIELGHGSGCAAKNA
jgi:hypothetical protein